MHSRTTRGQVRRRAFQWTVVLSAVAALSCYLAAYAVLHVEHWYVPSNPLSLPGPLGTLPGVTKGDIPVGRRVTIALLGMDTRPSEKVHDTRSDSLMLLTVDPKTKTGGILSIPRDSYVKIPDPRRRGGYLWDRVNTAFEYGYIYHYSGGGPQLLKDTLMLNYGIKVDYYVVVDWPAFVKVVDSVGGIDIKVDKYLYSDQVQIPELHQNWARFTPGTYHMDGQTALAYARMRPDSDFGRIERQQQVLVAVAHKALSLGLITTPTKVLQLYKEYQSSVQTDLPDVQAPGLAQLGLSIGLDNLRRGSFGDGAVVGYVGPGCADLLLPLPQKSGEIAAQVFDDPSVGETAGQHLAAQGFGNPANFRDYSSACSGTAPDSGSSPGPVPRTPTPSATPHPSVTPTPTSTVHPSVTPTRTPTAKATATPTATKSRVFQTPIAPGAQVGGTTPARR